ncbi:hypothetical protein [Chryseobacterium binzhouense]|uniref:hypothetical protein n=1 Tax=Chryseobacterium binzhouense TaxID=2593646 RepID=UPI0028A2146E|nr:hypothetical protein [Chryseobacterium binzhouense]
MRLITIIDRQEKIHHINVNFIVRIEIQKDGYITIWDANNFSINTYMNYADFLQSLGS